MNCIVCSSALSDGLKPWHRRCPSCGYECADLAPSINEAAAHDQVNEADREIALKGLRTDNFRKIVGRIRPLVGKSAARLLDVGCAHGWFLEAAAKEFQVLGIEPDVAVGSQAASRCLPVRAGYFPEALRPQERFDLIVFNDVIEHIPDIRGALAAAHDRLNPDGLLVLNLPSSRGVFYRLACLLATLGWSSPFDRMWQLGMPSPHVHYFAIDNLSTLVERHGFVRVEHFALQSIRASGLLERLRFVGKSGTLAVWLQYLAILAGIPVLRLLPSDIVVGIFRKQA